MVIEGIFKEIMDINYYCAVVINYLIGLFLLYYIKAEKREHTDWEVPKNAYKVIAFFFLYGLIPGINNLLLIFTILFVFFFVTYFVIFVIFFEIEFFIENKLKRKEE